MLRRLAVSFVPGLLVAQDLTELPRFHGETFASCTSADPSGGNDDSGHYLATLPDGTRVLAVFAGPGRLVRMWSAEPQGDVVLEIDGVARYRGPFRGLFDGSVPPFVPPLAGPFAGGWLNHVEVPFAQQCRLLSPPGPGTYHQIGALLGERAAPVALPAPEPAGPARTVEVGSVATPLVSIGGPAELVELRVRVLRGEPRGIWLEAVADGAREPTLQGPLDLLLPGDLRTVPVADAEGGGTTLRLPMPCRERLVVAARSLGGPAAVEVSAVRRPLPQGHDRGYLHARWHRQQNVWGEPFPLLAVDGRRGHVVGVTAELCGAPGQGLSFLEGDERATVDGQVVLRGTGTEDFFSGGWYFRGNPAHSPCVAVAAIDPRLVRVRVARFLLVDPLPFRERCELVLEHGGGNDAPGSDYAAVVWWYDDRADGIPRAANALPPGTPLPPPQWQDVPVSQVFPDAVVDSVAATLSPGRHPLRTDGPVACTPLRAGRAVLPTVLVEAGATGTLDVREATALDAVRLEPALPALRHWRVVGPFAGGERRGLDRGHAPERDHDETHEYDVLGDGPRGWRGVDVAAASGVLDLDPLCGGRDEVVAFAATWVSSPVDQPVVLWLGSDDAVRVYLDGVAVHEHRGVRGAARDQDRVPLRLSAGEHELRLEVEDYRGGFGCFARIEGQGLTSRAFRGR